MYQEIQVGLTNNIRYEDEDVFMRVILLPSNSMMCCAIPIY